MAAFDDPCVRESLVEFASTLSRAGHSVQGVVATHLEAVRGCAHFLEAPPRLNAEAHEGADAEAWRCVDRLVFDLERQRVGARDCSRAEDAWLVLLGDLAGAAVDVLYRLYCAHLVTVPGEESAHTQLLQTYPEEVRSLLAWCLVNRDSITSYFQQVHPPLAAERDRYVVETLGLVGDTSTAVLLRRYAQDPALGEAAAAAVWKIERSRSLPGP
jgi:hypothetical protein